VVRALVGTQLLKIGEKVKGPGKHLKLKKKMLATLKEILKLRKLTKLTGLDSCGRSTYLKWYDGRGKSIVPREGLLCRCSTIL
jgi:hypothetical protein